MTLRLFVLGAVLLVSSAAHAQDNDPVVTSMQAWFACGVNYVEAQMGTSADPVKTLATDGLMQCKAERDAYDAAMKAANAEWTAEQQAHGLQATQDMLAQKMAAHYGE